MSSGFDYYYIVKFLLVIFFFRWLSVIWQKWEFLPQFELLCPRRLCGWLPPLSWTAVGWDIPGTHSQIFLIWWPQPAPHFRKHFYGTSPAETRPVDIPHPSAYFSAWAGRQSGGTSDKWKLININIHSEVASEVINITQLSSSTINWWMSPCSAATFHSVSFSKPNPVWFGKIQPKIAYDFPN